MSTEQIIANTLKMGSRSEQLQALAKLQEQLQVEKKIKAGAEMMLQVYETSQKGDTISVKEVETQLQVSNKKIAAIQKQMEYFKTLEAGGPGLKRSHSERAAGKPPARSLSEKFKRNDAEIVKNVGPAISELLVRIRNTLEIPHIRLECMNSLLKVMKAVGNVEEFYPVDDIVKSVRTCLVDGQKEMRANCFRFLRHLMSNNRNVKTIFDAHIEVFVVRALTRDNRYDVEREQTIRLIRSCIDVKGGGELIPQSIVRSLVAIAEQPDDKFKTICLETLCEIAIRNPQIIAYCGGFKIIISGLIEGPKELSSSILYAVLYMLDSEETRNFLRPAVELEMLIANFADAYGKGSAHDERLASSAKAVVTLLKSWPGVLYLCVDERRALKAVVESLRLPNEETRKILLEMFCEIFLIEIPKWYPDFVSARSRLALSYPSFDELSASARQELVNLYPSKKRMNLLDQYQTLILASFVEVGLIEALIDMIQDGSKYITTRATILVGEIRDLCNRLLPPHYNRKINSLPTLFQVAANFEDEPHRHNATLALSQIDTLHNNKEKFLMQSLDDPVARRWLARTMALKYGNGLSRPIKRQVEDARQRMRVQIDDVQFKTLLAEVEVASIREYSKWNWDGITELIQGPLRNPKRLDEAIKSSKLLKRLLYFYRPVNGQFADVKKGKTRIKYVTIGCELFETLLMNIDGMRFLVESKLLQEIGECLSQLDPYEEQLDVMFSRSRMAKTLTSEYFILLGTLTKHPEGHKLLERCRVFTTFYHLSELRNRDDVVKAMITGMDYNIDAHPRVILSKVMTSASKAMRVFATRHMRFLYRTNTQDFWDWGIKLLITQLYDPVDAICECAVDVLDEVFDDEKNLAAAIYLRPTLMHLGEAGNPLLLRFLSTTLGFRYLKKLDCLESEVDNWFKFRNLHYVTRMEINLSRSFSNKNDSRNIATDDTELQAWDAFGTVPPHLYGELTKTTEGCDLLRQKGHFKEFVEFARMYGFSDMPQQETVRKLKAVLWAIGHIGSTPTGLIFLIDAEVIKNIVDIANTSTVLSLKGTCYYVLGLISCTRQGADILEKLGWRAVVRSDGQLEGLCVPMDVSKFVLIPIWKYQGSWPEKRQKLKYTEHTMDDIEQQIMRHIGNLANHILANQSSKELSKIRHDNPQYFTQVRFFILVQRAISTTHYRLQARRFLLELFDRVSFNEESLLKLDKMNGLKYEEKSEFWSEVEDDMKDDQLSNLMMLSGNSAGVRRGRTQVHVAAMKEDVAPEERVVMKPLKVKKGFTPL